MKITNDINGQEIHLQETDDIIKLKNQLMLLGINRLAYSPWAKIIQNKIKKLKEEKKEEEYEEETEEDYEEENYDAD